MPMSADEKKAYSRGYAASGSRRWPDHRPPLPPDEVIAGLMAALLELRNECDGLLATIDPDDDFAKALDPRLDAADDALRAVAKWLFRDDEALDFNSRIAAASKRYYEKNRDAILAKKRREWSKRKRPNDKFTGSQRDDR